MCYLTLCILLYGIYNKEHKHVLLTVKQTLEIIQKLEKGSSTKNTTVTYRAGETAVHDNQKNLK
jgi:hypothetical protein